MKKKLFVSAVAVLLYSLFIISFTLADSQGQISKVLTKVGLSNSSDLTSVHSDNSINGNLIDPIPLPKIDPIPRPKIDPIPRPKIDPIPRPKIDPIPRPK